MFWELWMPVFICCSAALLAALAICIPFGARSGRTSGTVDHLTGALSVQKKCSMENMSVIGAQISNAGNPALSAAWERLSASTENMFMGEGTPEPELYFTDSDIFGIPNREKLLGVLWVILPVFAFIGAVATVVSMLFSQAEITPALIRAGLAAACTTIGGSAIVFALSYSYIYRVRQTNETALFRFNRTLAAILPVVNQSTQAALLLQASRRNTEAFAESAKSISDRLDDFAVNGITPVVSYAFRKAIAVHLTPGIAEMERTIIELSSSVISRQENGMAELAAAFSDSLSGTLSAQIKAMSEDIKILASDLGGLQSELTGTAAALGKSLAEDREVLRETAEINNAAARNQETTARNLGEMSEALSRTEKLVMQLDARDESVFTHLSEASDRTAELQEQLKEQLLTACDMTNQAAATMAETASAVSEAAQSLIVSANETGERTNALITEKLTEILGETNASNAETYAKISDSVASLLAVTGETVDRGYERVAEKLTEILGETNASNAETYAKISDSIAALITAAGETADRGYERVTEKLAEILGETNVSNAETYAKISDSIAALIAAAGETADRGYERVTEKLAEILGELSASNAETYAKISDSVSALAVSTGETVDAVFKRYAESLIDTLNQSITMNDETSRKLASTMDSLALAGTEQYEKAAKAAAKLLEDVVVEMNKAMDGVGHEIAESISQASAGSAEIVERLAQKTSQLKEEYDLYFSRVENQSAANLNEMEFRIQNVFSRFSDEASGIMDRLESNISSSMNLFEGNTASLLHNIEEESRSIGLYVKDLNIDVTSLSTTLRESVGIFTDQMKTSTEKTFEAFDDGLAEVSERLANTVESIRESVENLPQVIGAIK